MKGVEFGIIEESGDGTDILTVSIANDAGLTNEDFQNRVRAHAMREAPPGVAIKYRWHFRFGRIVRAEIVFAEK